MEWKLLGSLVRANLDVISPKPATSCVPTNCKVSLAWNLRVSLVRANELQRESGMEPA